MYINHKYTNKRHDIFMFLMKITDENMFDRL